FHCNGFGHLLSLYCFRSQFLYSTTSTRNRISTHFLIKYLVDSLGFSRKEAISTSSKLTPQKTIKNPDLLLNFLIQTGFDETQIKKLVFRAPRLLYRDVSRTLIPKRQCLVDLGLSGSDLVSVIAKDPNIFERSFDTHLRPTIGCLRRILGSDEDVVKAIKRAVWLLSFGTHHIMETNVLLLRNYGFSDLMIKKFVLRNPNSITQKSEWFKDLLHRVEKDFQVTPDSATFLHGFRALASQKKSTLEKKIGWKIAMFKSFGWSDDEILELFRKLPLCIALSEVRIEKALNLYMKELSFEPSYLASRPAFLAYSLEKRVIPRMQVLKILDEKKLERRK
ncbi:transcription termination factor mterf5, chloroplastic, partial [Nicotiana attenuata]